MAENLKGLQSRKTLAEEALAAGDLMALKRLFDESCQDIHDLAGGVRALAGFEDKYPQRDNTIQAMRDVALEAIQLARDVAIGRTTLAQ